MTESPTQAKDRSIIVIGAGIVGVSAALALQQEGHAVTLLDRRGVAEETSRGNAGAFAFTDIEPLASPGILLKAPKWLLDPLGPLSLRPAYALKILPWARHFYAASRPRRHAASISAQAQLMALSRHALERQIARVAGEPLIRREGQLQVYEGEAEYRASLPAWALRRQHGIAFDLIEGAEAIAEIQPGLAPRFTHAGFTPDWMNVVDPKLWTEHLAARFTALGGVIETAEVLSLAQTDGAVELTTGAGQHRADQVVVAAGAWSHRLARTLGDRIPLETERGYNTTFPTRSFDLRTHITFSNHGFVVSRIGDGLRVGGAVELGGLDLAPSYKRSEVLVQKAVTFLQGFDGTGGTPWMGFRPSMPDSLPAVGRSPRADRVIYAFGHGHLGLTQSAGTAELVADIAARRPPALDIAPYDPLRFGGLAG
ncbi:NAD(P)/FAD-dependent oxidoreductase [Pseudoroseicyclus aestuarii]|uniref:Glycine/D-amino acid oxidase-like deaminating enzyme n=1 Tax=Pseudoroseicyclus aestuarii TaxID=1795041 RepID=A0A318SVR8_9RHOB|nr:FAD-dependent oxidoreductase [Pseudoroseicyclus aestuarii]PYE85525.1 glycine/D-amino acid oxidase-like deaminating enzyme [Pseudoroseicyclus aestuarii]